MSLFKNCSSRTLNTKRVKCGGDKKKNNFKIFGPHFRSRDAEIQQFRTFTARLYLQIYIVEAM